MSDESVLRKVLTGPGGFGTSQVRQIEVTFDAIKGTPEVMDIAVEVLRLLGWRLCGGQITRDKISGPYLLFVPEDDNQGGGS